jgi:hypothetical protein
MVLVQSQGRTSGRRADAVLGRTGAATEGPLRKIARGPSSVPPLAVGEDLPEGFLKRFLNGVSISPDGWQIVSVGNSGTIKVWDATPLPQSPGT